MTRRVRPSRLVLTANLERETQARLKAEERLERQGLYIESLPYPSDLSAAENSLDHLAEAVCWVLGAGQLGKQSERRLRDALNHIGMGVGG